MKKDMPPPELSVVVPVYNEEKSIAETLRRLEAFLSLKKFDWEVIVSSDGSNDRTAEIVGSWIRQRGNDRFRLLDFKTNLGKGAAVRRGVLEARGGKVLFTDADLSAPIKESDKLLRALEGGADVAIGSRTVPGSDTEVRQSFKRWLSGRIYNFFVKRLVFSGFGDTQCGFKMFTAKAARDLFSRQTLQGFSFDVEILMLARQSGYKIAEVPVMWRQGPDSRVRLARDSVRMIKELFQIRRAR